MEQAPDTVSEPRPIEVNALGIVYQIKLVDGRDIAYEAKLPSDCEQRDIDELLDRIHAATERQVARATLTSKRERVLLLKVRLELQEQQYAQTEAEQLTRWGASRKQGDFRRSEAQAATLANIMTTIAGLRADIPVAEWEVKRLEAIIEGREPPVLEPKTLKAALDKQPAQPRPGYAQAAE